MSSSAHVAPWRPVRFHCIILCTVPNLYCTNEPLFICQDAFYHCSLSSQARITMTFLSLKVLFDPHSHGRLLQNRLTQLPCLCSTHAIQANQKCGFLILF